MSRRCCDEWYICQFFRQLTQSEDEDDDPPINMINTNENEPEASSAVSAASRASAVLYTININRQSWNSIHTSDPRLNELSPDNQNQNQNQNQDQGLISLEPYSHLDFE
jgi:hypothetical protein